MTTEVMIEEMIEVMNAYKEGIQIETKIKYDENDVWTDITFPHWNWDKYDYRIKPEPIHYPDPKFYIFRNKRGSLYMFENYPPYIDEETGDFRCNPETGTNIIGELPYYMFPEVTYETGIKMVELKIKE